MEREFYYYERDRRNGRLIGTRCLILANGLWARGTAICSENDNFCKATGRAIARGRAVKALKTGEDGNPVFRLEVVWRISEAGFRVGYKNAFCPKMTGLEERLINKKPW